MVRTYEECVEEQVECPCKTPCANEYQQQAVQVRLDLGAIPKSFPFSDEEKYYSDLTGEFKSEIYMADVDVFFTKFMVKLLPYIQAKNILDLAEAMRG